MISKTDLPADSFSPITPEVYAKQSGKLSDVQACKQTLCYLESRPQESGRNALVICEPNQSPFDLLPAPASIRTRAQEYGGASYLLTEHNIFYVLDADQEIYRFDRIQKTHHKLTHHNTHSLFNFRFADFCWDEKHLRLVAICEDYSSVNIAHSQHPTSKIVAIATELDNSMQVLVEGADFYSNPRISPKADQLSYLAWNHPYMPWDSTNCFCADLKINGTVQSTFQVAGGEGESIFQPQWSPTGELYLVSDKNNWWNIYRYAQNQLKIVCEMPAEFATPQWVFGMSCYEFLNHNQIICCFSSEGKWNLAIIDIRTQSITQLNADDTENPFRDITCICTTDNLAYFLAGTHKEPIKLWCYQEGKSKPVHPINPSFLSLENISNAESIQFPTCDGDIAHGFFYAPTINFEENKLPPLLVMCHGGPTGATESSLSVKVQFWTSRGFAVVDVNFRGSTGFGRRYRDKLKGYWGVRDVIDVCSAANYLIEKNLVDKNRIVMRGSSAGGFTVLAALSFCQHYFSEPLFCAGTSLYGIGDLEALAKDTHKFEAHYLDQLIGKYPEELSLYRERSPLYHLDGFNCPVIFFQGLKDKVVPPEQAIAMVNALQQKSIRADYVCFKDEGHGFRNATNVQEAIEKELAFYLSIFKSNARN